MGIFKFILRNKNQSLVNRGIMCKNILRLILRTRVNQLFLNSG
jgi:hypothetical protein